MKTTELKLRIPHLLTFLVLISIALPSAACSCGRLSSFTELFATPDPQNRYVQALIVKNVGTDGRGVEVEVMERLTPGEVKNRIVIFGADGGSCKGPIVHEPGAIWIAAISREESALAAQHPAYDIASCAESFLSYDPDKKLATGAGSQSNPRLTGRVSLANLRRRLNQDFKWDYTHLSCKSEIIDVHNRVFYGQEEIIFEFDETDSLDGQIDYSIDVPMLDEPYRYRADISVRGNPGSVRETAHFDVVLQNETGAPSLHSEEGHSLFMGSDSTYLNFKKQYQGKVSGGGNMVCLPFTGDRSDVSGWCVRTAEQNGGLVKNTFLREDPNRSGPFSLRATLKCDIHAELADANSPLERSESEHFENSDAVVESLVEFGDRSAWSSTSNESRCALNYSFPGGSMEFSYLKFGALQPEDITDSNGNRMKLLEYKTPHQSKGKIRFSVRTGRETQSGSVAVKVNGRQWHLDQGVRSIRLGVMGPVPGTDEIIQEISIPSIQINYIDGSEADDLLALITNPTRFVLTATLLNNDAPLRLNLKSTRIADASSQFRACMEH